MRKFVLASICGLLLVNCTNQELVDDNSGTTSSESSFLSVSIISSGNTGTRAVSSGDSDYTEPDKSDNTYRDGTNAENAVTNVLLLFFDDNGTPVQAIKDQSGNNLTYYEWNPTDTGNEDHSHTIEKILEGTIPISVPRRNNTVKWPTQLLAIVNPPAVNDFTGKSLSDLNKVFSDYETDLQESGKFVMMNSVYVDETNNIVYTARLTEENFREKIEDAKKYPVTIYVERILARIDLKIDIKGNDKPIQITPEDGSTPYYIYHTGEKVEKPDENTKDNDIYVRFLGWNVFDTPDQSYLIKKIDKNWKTEDIFGYADGVRPWNITAYRRSFWAINPKERANENDLEENGIFHKVGTFGPDVKEGDFDETTHQWTASHNAIPVPNEYTTAYFQENAAPASDVNKGPITPSKVILAAQLVDDKGKPRELARWGGKLYTWEGLKAYLCNAVLTDLYYLNYGEDVETGNTTHIYTQVTPDDLHYVLDKEKNLVSVVLSSNGAAKNWYKRNGGENDEDKRFVAVAGNDYIASTVGEKNVSFWSNGYCYFYFTIRHLGKSAADMAKEEKSAVPGEFGIVRNHIYEATVTSVKGLGTPVSDPREEIIPTQDEETGVIAAKINILSWRVVRQDYDLNW